MFAVLFDPSSGIWTANLWRCELKAEIPEMASTIGENSRGKIDSILNDFDAGTLQFVLRHMFTFQDFTLFKISGSLKTSRQTISNLLDGCDDNLLQFLYNQFFTFGKDIQLAPRAGRDITETYRQSLERLLDQMEEGDLRGIEQIISSYTSMARAVTGSGEENPRVAIKTILDKLDSANLRTVLQHLLIIQEHSAGDFVQLHP
ncbi:uncharacterized protein [Heterodontus francisci]|uniref:uncharacterized protein n=1 Tax=Heterodontus francisci TaxID=7792 RepID=UPI00355C155D